MEIGCTVATPLYCDACHVVEKSSCVWKLSTPSVPLYKHLKLSNAKIAGMEKDACALPFVSTQVWEETAVHEGEHGVVDGNLRSKRMWGSTGV